MDKARYNMKNTIKLLTINKIKDMAFNENSIWSSNTPEGKFEMKKRAIVIPSPCKNYLCIATTANNRKSETMEYRRWFNRYGEIVATTDNRYGDWYDATKKHTAVIHSSDINEYSRIKNWLESTDPTFTKFKQATIK